ncbi:MAG: DUF5615 family PIN-like protein [Chloroflexi bacterium]|nr:DUF5615 family PIN-like protein [Chloroflexota bacterium]
MSAGHDVAWAGEWIEDPGDEEILRLAHSESRILVTLDKDFGELAVLHQQPHSGILRLVNWSTGQPDSRRKCVFTCLTSMEKNFRPAL